MNDLRNELFTLFLCIKCGKVVDVYDIGFIHFISVLFFIYTLSGGFSKDWDEKLFFSSQWCLLKKNSSSIW